MPPRSIALLVLCAILSAAPLARAELVCLDAVSVSGAGAGYTADELRTSSRPIFAAIEACACRTPTWRGGPPPVYGPCARACEVWIPDDGDYACGLTSPLAWSQACDDCVAPNAETLTGCGAEMLACIGDVP